MPPPLGARRASSFPLALGHLAPLHIEADAFQTYVTSGALEGALLRPGAAIVGAALRSPLRPLVDRVLDRQPEGPTDTQRARGKWTILVEARSGETWRNVILTGTDVYGLTAQTLASAGLEMSSEGYDKSGVVAPVQAMGLDKLREDLARLGVTIDPHGA